MDNKEKLQKQTEEIIKRNKENMKEWKRKCEDDAKQREEKLQRRSLLMLQPSVDKTKKMAKIEGLKKMRETMKEKGVKNVSELFTPEEKDLLREADLAQKRK